MAESGFAIEEATIAGIHLAMESGELTASGLTETYLQRIDAIDKGGPKLNSIINVNTKASERAEQLDKARAQSGEFVGPLHGIPVLVKDCIETNDVPTTFGSEVFAEYQPKNDATLIKRIQDAGAIVLAKTALPDWATSWWAYCSAIGETRNPYMLDGDPGGSSGGTGASVSANLGVGLGTDCGGSIRVQRRSATSSVCDPASSAATASAASSSTRIRSARWPGQSLTPRL